MTEKSIQLTSDEIFLVAVHAIDRRMQKIRGHRKPREEDRPNDWNGEIEGSLAEYGWSKLREKPWTGLAGVKAQDGADGVEIRWTRHAAGGLVIYPDRDDDDSIFILSKGGAAEGYVYRFVGWLRGVDAKRLADRVSWGWLVPAESLKPMDVSPWGSA